MLINKLKIYHRKLDREVRIVFENFFFINILNITQYIFPFILIPYLIIKLEAQNYGIYAFSFAVYQYFILFVSYGIDLYGVRKIALVANSIEDRNRVFSIFLTLRVLIALISILILIILCLWISPFKDYRVVFIAGIGVILGTAIIPVYFFQGMEKMKFFTIISFFSRLLSMLLIFLFVNSSTDLVFVNISYSIGYLANAVFSLMILHKYFNFRFFPPNLDQLKNQFKENWHIFLSTLGMSFYRESNTIILGYFVSYEIVAYYSIAEKLVKVIQSFFAPLIQAVYPYFSRNFDKDKSRSKRKFLWLIKYISLLLLVVTFVIFLSSEWLLQLYLNDGYNDIILNIFRILMPILFLGTMNYFIGIVGLFSNGESKAFTKFVLIAGLVCLSLEFILINFFYENGAAIAIVITETLLLALVSFKYFNINYSNLLIKNSH